jgi:hypothetical protein
MTPFGRTDPTEPAFRTALERYFGAEADPRTVELLGRGALAGGLAPRQRPPPDAGHLVPPDTPPGNPGGRSRPARGRPSATPPRRAALACGTRDREGAQMTADPSAPAPGGAPQPPATPSPPPAVDDAPRPAPVSGHAAADTLADAADEKGTVRSTRRMPEPDSLGG